MQEILNNFYYIGIISRVITLMKLKRTAVLEFERVPGNITVVEGDTLSWSVDIKYYPNPPE